MRMMVQNQIIGEPKLADVEVDSLKIHVKLVDEPVEFTCEYTGKINEDDIKILTNDFTIPFGLRKFRIIESTKPYTKSNYEITKEDALEGLELFFGGSDNAHNGAKSNYGRTETS